MQIDWLTVAAQIVNFLVLVWLLQRFLYRPISAAMRRREERIEERLAEAETARREAGEEAERLRSERASLDEARDEMLDQARADAEDLRRKLDSEIREEMEEKRETWRRHIEEERAEFARRLQRRAGRQLLDIAERVLGEFADADLSERIATTFVARLDALDDDVRGKLAEAAGRADGATVATGRAIGSAARGRITRKLHEILSADIEVAYREDADVLLGVRLTIGKQTVEWSASRYLNRLGDALDEILESEGHGPSSGATGAGGEEEYGAAAERRAT